MNTGGIGKAQRAAIGGIQRAANLMDRSAADVAHQGLVANQAGNVRISPEARALASASSTAEPSDTTAGATANAATGTRDADGDSDGDLAQALVNQNVAKNLNAANVKVLQTSEDMSDTLNQLGKRR